MNTSQDTHHHLYQCVVETRTQVSTGGQGCDGEGPSGERREGLCGGHALR